MKTSCILILTAVIAIVTKEGTSRYLLVEVDNKETNVDTLIESRQSTCPLVGIGYTEKNDSNYLLGSYVDDWHKCGNLCENHIHPGNCEFWTFLQKSERSGHCWLFSAYEEMLENDWARSGHKGCQ